MASLSIVLAVFSVYAHFIEKLYYFLLDQESLVIGEFLANFAFLYLAGLLFVTYRRWKKANARQKELENVIESISPDALLVVNSDNRITMCNSSIRKIFGYDVEEVIDKTTDMLFAEHLTNTALCGEISKALEEEGFHISAGKGKQKNGQPVNLEIITGRLKHTDGAVLLLRDVTLFKETEKRHLHDKELLRLITENMDDFVAVLDTDGRRLYNSPSYRKIFDDLESLKDSDSFAEIHPDDRQQIKNLFRETVETGMGQRTMFRFLLKDGEVRSIESQGSVIKDEEGKVANVIVVSRDITSRKQAEEERERLQTQLRQSQKMEAIGTLAGGVAHDFNNILTTIIGYANLLQANIDNDTPQKLYIDNILVASRKAASLTQGLLAFSRKQAVELRPRQLNQIISGVEKLLKRLLTEDIEFTVTLADSDITVMSDAGQIDQVLMNLATNARDAMPRGGRLTVATKEVYLDHEFIQFHGYGKPGNFAVISVADTGLGMDEKTREKIFEPFFTTKEVGKGTGLGLSMVYGIVKQHNGYINVFSEGGKGTTFNIYIPAVKA